MVITEQKPFQKILESLKGYTKIFLVGCGECSTSCKTGGEKEVMQLKEALEKNDKTVVGFVIPNAPCIASQVKMGFAKNKKALEEAEVILSLTCGLGAQSIKENDRLGHVVLPACNTVCMGVMDAQGNFFERCSACGECVLDITGGICPITLCPKGLLNGPCGGMDKGKCEVDREKDCAWVLIYKELERRKKLDEMKKIQKPKDFKKATKPHKLTMVQ